MHAHVQAGKVSELPSYIRLPLEKNVTGNNIKLIINQMPVGYLWYLRSAGEKVALS